MDHVNKEEPSDRPTAKLILLGYDFQYLSVLLNSFFFVFLPDVSKGRHWRIVTKFKIEAIITRTTQTVVTNRRNIRRNM